MPLKIQIRLHIDFSHLKIINVYLPLPEVVPHQTKHHLKKMFYLFDCLASNESFPRFYLEADNFIDFLEAIASRNLKTEDNRSFLAKKVEQNTIVKNVRFKVCKICFKLYKVYQMKNK